MPRQGHNRGPHKRLVCLGWTVTLVLLAATSGWSQQVTLPEMREDALLRDVFFLNPDQGWAVGDRGVIWQTIDGGRNWRRQTSGVTSRLSSVHFVDAQHGWVVGGRVHLYTHKSSGVVLYTSDGGVHWHQLPNTTLPRLHKVKFIDHRRGWAVGDSSALFPNGVFRTEDHGRSWASVPGGTAHGALTGDFRDIRTGVVVGRDGLMGLVLDRELKPSRTPGVGWRHIRQVRLEGPTDGWLVGDGALIMRTSDGGVSWQRPGGGLPPGLGDHLDFKALAAFGSNCWVAGTPGSRVLHTADGGKTWQVFSTQQNLPIHSLFFLDPHRGWAVGALGTILATRDGGRSWRRQRSGGTRAAMLGVFSESRRIPWEVFAEACGNDGYLGAVEVLNRRDLEATDYATAALDERTHDAIAAVGGVASSTAWRFPVRQAGLKWTAESIVDGWTQMNDGRGTPLVEQHVVRLLRQWRPEVVITDPPSPRGHDAVGHLANQLVLAAVERAADPTAYPDQLRLAGLEAWQVKKVFCMQDDGAATVTVNTSQLALRLGQSLSEYAVGGRGLIESTSRPAPPSIGLQLLVNRVPDKIGRRGLFHGLALQAGGEARRAVSARANVTSLDQLRQAAQRRRNVEQLLERSSNDTHGSAAWLSQVDELTGGLSSAARGQLLYQLGQTYLRQGQTELAAETYGLLAERHPQHPLADAALVWLIQYYCSGEAAWRLRQTTQVNGGQVAVTNDRPAPIVRRATYEEPVDPNAAGQRTRLVGPRRVAAASAGLKLDERAQEAIRWGHHVGRNNPALFADPQLRFPLTVAQRQRGLGREAESYLHAIAGTHTHTAWSRCAQTELWLKHGNQAPPKPVFKCTRVQIKPRLDGQLEPAFWNAIEPIALGGGGESDQPPPAAIRLGYDDEYLYLAVHCRKLANVDYPTTNVPRPRDPDLTDHDRVELLLDVDRDYVSWYRLTVDHRGWTGESCLGDASWNPEWFVAAAADPKQWIVEAAIPWTSLTGKPPQARAAWAVGAQRLIPNVGIHAATQPATVEPRGENFGLLVFP